jgi:uncharacterized protein (TIGR02271 family)
MYADTQLVNSVVHDLESAGFKHHDLTIMSKNTGSGLGSVSDASASKLRDMGASEAQARAYIEGVNRGNTVIAVEVSDDEVAEAQRIMERQGLIDVEGSMYQQSTQQNLQSNMSGTSRATQKSHSDAIDDETIEVVEEDLQIGKRAVETGGVRINTFVREVPIEEEVRLREERVHVERRPVDRPATAADLESFREQSFEIRETQEKAVISKEARVVEEVHISKDVEEHAETIRDTVRRTEVEVEQLGSQRSSNASSYDMYDSGFRTHWQSNYATSGLAYERYQPAYRYGYTLANDERYRGRNWNEIESNVRRDWESQNQGPWENFKDSIRHAWDQVRGRA